MNIYEYIMGAPENSPLELDESQVEELRDFINSIMKWNVAEESVYAALRKEVFDLNAQLSKLKPNWDNAPDWAEKVIITYAWAGNGHVTTRYQTIFDFYDIIAEQALQDERKNKKQRDNYISFLEAKNKSLNSDQ